MPKRKAQHRVDRLADSSDDDDDEEAEEEESNAIASNLLLADSSSSSSSSYEDDYAIIAAATAVVAAAAAVASELTDSSSSDSEDIEPTSSRENEMEATADTGGGYTTTAAAAAAIPAIIHCTKQALDESDIRFGSTPCWKEDIPDLLPAYEMDPEDNEGRYQHQALVIPVKDDDDDDDTNNNNNNNNQQALHKNKIDQTFDLVVIGGTQLEDGHEAYSSSLHSLRLRQQREPTMKEWKWRISSFPDMNEERSNFGVVHAKRKIYVFGGSNPATFEILDLDNVEAGWTTHEIPHHNNDAQYFRAVLINNRYIYVISCDTSGSTAIMQFDAYDTQTNTWQQKAKPIQTPRMGFAMTSIKIPGEGSYIVVLGGCKSIQDLELSVEAYHVETDKWIHLTDIPGDDYDYRNECMATTLGNRYILLAGGGETDTSSFASDSVIALDWKTKEWLELPSLPAPQTGGAGVIVGAGSINKWIVTGGWGNYMEGPAKPASLDISEGLGWAKEKLMLLCFRGKARKNEDDGVCLLEGLDSGIFANILLYLFVPFPCEVRCKGSIFTSFSKTS